MKRTSLVVCVVVLCVIVFSGQQRYRTPQRSSTTPRPQTPQRPKPQEQPPLPEEPQTPIQYLLPEDIQWPSSTHPTAPRNVTLIGDPRKPAMYVTRTLIPKGAKGVPHFHTDTRTVVVISGTYFYGTGDEFDEKKLIPLPPGSLLLEPAGEPHYVWAKDGDVIVQTTGIGPTSTDFPKPRKPEQAPDRKP